MRRITKAQAAAARGARERREAMHEHGIKPGVAQAFGFRDAASPHPEHDPAACDTFGCELCLAIANRGAA